MRRLLYILTAVLVAGCVYPYNDALQTPDIPVYVFDGNISVGGEASLTISSMYGLDPSYRYSTGKRQPDSWWVEDETGIRYFPPSISGKINLHDAPADRKYRMVARIDEKIYSTAFRQPETPPQIDSINFSADDENVYCSVSFSGGSDNSVYASVGIEEIWNFHAAFVQKITLVAYPYLHIEDVDPYNNQQNYWCWKQVKNEWETIVDFSKMGGKAEGLVVNTFRRKDNRNHREYIIRIRLRAIDREEYQFKKNLETLGQQANSLFTANPGDVASNVICETDPSERVLGFISTSRYTYKEAVLDNRYMIDWNPYLYTLVFVKQDVDVMTEYYNNGWLPVLKDFLDDAPVKVPFWGQARCVDCVADGGTLEKPTFSE